MMVKSLVIIGSVIFLIVDAGTYILASPARSRFVYKLPFGGILALIKFGRQGQGD
jgi:hypothetical protein